MNTAMKNCRHVPGWERAFLTSLELGTSERTSMHRAGIGAGNVRDRCDKDSVFKERYEHAKAKGAARGRPVGGMIL